MTRLLPLPAARPWSAAALLPPLLSSALRSIFQRQSSRPLRIPAFPPVYAPFRRFPAKRSSRNSFPCHSYKIFHSPYPASPLFATLTQTWRVSIISSHSGTHCLPSVPTSAPLFCTKRQKPTPCFQQLAHSFALRWEGVGGTRGYYPMRTIRCSLKFSLPAKSFNSVNPSPLHCAKNGRKH